MTISEKFKTIASYQSNYFKKWFGDMPFKKGEVIKTSKKLPRYMNDKEILSELKPEPVSLGDVYATLDEGDKDIWYLFYCKDSTGVLRTVRVNRSDDGWVVIANSVEDPGEWGDGYQVFARNFDTQTLDTSNSALGTLATWELEYELVGKVWKSKKTGELKITLNEMFKDNKDGQTHYYGDNCGEPTHNTPPLATIEAEWKARLVKEIEKKKILPVEVPHKSPYISGWNEAIEVAIEIIKQTK